MLEVYCRIELLSRVLIRSTYFDLIPSTLVTLHRSLLLSEARVALIICCNGGTMHGIRIVSVYVVCLSASNLD